MADGFEAGTYFAGSGCDMDIDVAADSLCSLTVCWWDIVVMAAGAVLGGPCPCDAPDSTPYSAIFSFDCSSLSCLCTCRFLETVMDAGAGEVAGAATVDGESLDTGKD